jgi:hypothetical protein
METKGLEELRRILIEGQRRSKQGSYMRRNPASAAIPFLLEARTALREYVRVNDTNAEALRLLSQAEECLLNYSAARQYLERAMSLSAQKDKKDMKKLALLIEYGNQWTELELTPAQLEDLGKYLRARLRENGCDHTLRFTRERLMGASRVKTKGFIEAVRNRGGFCDCEVLNNVVMG